MRFRTATVVLIVILSLGGAAVYGFAAGGGGGGLQTLWVSDTAQPVLANHHAPAAGRVDGQSVVYAPISGNYSSDQCALVALDGTTGEQIWNYSIPPKNCTIHSVADPAIADANEDGIKEVLIETTENRIRGFEGLSGQQLFSYNLTSYGYTKPIVADFVEGEGKEVIAVDTNGTAVVIHPNGTVAWQQHVSGYVNSQPALADFSGDGTTELAVGFGANALVVFDADGTVEWNRSSPLNSTITWMTTGQSDQDPPTEIVIANTEGQVVAFDGAEGEIEWERDFGDFSAVRSLDDGDGDGQPELYVVARDGKLRSLNATTGTTEWTTTLDTGDIQMVPAPSLGDVDGDGQPELVSVTNSGVVSVIDPQTGDVLGSYERDVPIWDHPELVDLNGDGADEIYVMYGDGRVAALSANRESS